MKQRDPDERHGEQNEIDRDVRERGWLDRRGPRRRRVSQEQTRRRQDGGEAQGASPMHGFSRGNGGGWECRRAFFVTAIVARCSV
jgi:hypothetical protein